MSIIDRLSTEPELFTQQNGLFIFHKNVIILVRSFKEWRWSLVIRGGEFKDGRVTVGYYRLSLVESLRVYSALKQIKK